VLWVRGSGCTLIDYITVNIFLLSQACETSP